jgi:hypothetical protein
MSFLMDLLFCKFTQDIYYRGVPTVLFSALSFVRGEVSLCLLAVKL